jgi:hypothetical protein
MKVRRGECRTESSRITDRVQTFLGMSAGHLRTESSGFDVPILKGLGLDFVRVRPGSTGDGILALLPLPSRNLGEAMGNPIFPSALAESSLPTGSSTDRVQARGRDLLATDRVQSELARRRPEIEGHSGERDRPIGLESITDQRCVGPVAAALEGEGDSAGSIASVSTRGRGGGHERDRWRSGPPGTEPWLGACVHRGPRSAGTPPARDPARCRWRPEPA